MNTPFFKLTYSVFFALTLSFSVSGQVIHDQTTPTEIYDALSLNDQTFKILSIGECKSGKLEISSKDSTINIFFPFTTDGKFYGVENDWTLLTNNMRADDVSGSFITLTYQDTTGELVQHSTDVDLNYAFTDYVVSDQGICFIPKNIDNKIYCLNKKTEVVDEYKVNYSSIFLAKVGSTLISVTSEAIHQLAPDMQIINSATLSQMPSEYVIYDNEIYLLSKDSIVAYSSTLEKRFTIPLETTLAVTDLEVNEFGVYVIGHNSSESKILHYESETWQLSYSIDNQHLQLTNFVSGDHNHLYGHSIFPHSSSSNIMNAIEVDRNEAYLLIDKLSLEEINLSVDSFVFETIFLPQDTIPIFHYNYEATLELSNLGTDTLHSFLLSSNRIQAFNCAHAGFTKHFNGLALAPGESMIIDAPFKALHIEFKELCYYLISVNGMTDPFFDNNYTCKRFSATAELQTASEQIFFPTCTNDRLYSKRTFNLSSKVNIHNSEGRRMFSITEFNNNQIDVSGLETGLYYIILEDRGDITVEKFLKI